MQVVQSAFELIANKEHTPFDPKAGYGRIDGKKYNSQIVKDWLKNGPGLSPSGDLLGAVLVRMHEHMIKGPPVGSGIERSNWLPTLDQFLMFQQAQNGLNDTPRPKLQGLKYSWDLDDKHNAHQDFGKKPQLNQKITLCFAPKVPGYENDGSWESRRIKEGPLTGRQQPPTPSRIAP